MVKNHFRLVILLTVVVLSMFAFGFALVPIYNSLCKTLGINGKITGPAGKYDPSQLKVAAERTITVEFVATNNGNLRWKFYPQTKK